MKKVLFILILVSLTINTLQAQFSFQASVRNNQGLALSNTTVTFKMSISQGDSLATPVYAETHSVTSNNYGIVSLSIGEGTVVSGVFSTIDWNLKPYFLKVEMDMTNSGNYTVMGYSELLSVPYAMVSNKVINEYDPVFTSSPAYNVTTNKINQWDTAYSWGNHATMGYLTEEVDGSITNEIELPSRVGMNGKFLRVKNTDTTVEWISLSNVAITGNYNDLTNKLVAGNGIMIDSNNLISVGLNGQVNGDMMYYSGTNWVRLPKGSDGQVLKMNGNNPTWSSNTVSGHYVGEIYGGGVVFYTWDNGTHGLIVSGEDWPSNVWGASIEIPNNGSFWDGVSNTASTAAYSSGGGIDEIYNNCNYGGYTDWYVGSVTEMNKLMESAFIVDQIFELDGNPNTYGLNKNTAYWTSTQLWSSLAYRVEFNLITTDASKNDVYPFRPIRKF